MFWTIQLIHFKVVINVRLVKLMRTNSNKLQKSSVYYSTSLVLDFNVSLNLLDLLFWKLSNNPFIYFLTPYKVIPHYVLKPYP